MAPQRTLLTETRKMARPHPNAEHHRNGASPSTASERRSVPELDVLGAAGLELMPEDEGLREELGRLANESEKVRAELENQLEATADTPGGDELFRLRAENEKLAHRVSELNCIADEMQIEQTNWESRQREYDSLLEEKSEVIRDLHRRLHDQPERPAGNVPREEELIALSEELERERRQLKDDEEALMEQMRQMEVQMSRERAELARQRNELQRLQNDVRHELELASRDATLRDRLAPLQRRHQEMVNRSGTARSAEHAAPQAIPAASGGGTGSARKDSSLFRKLFG
jgi:chromosome segregation ATPase